MALPVIIYVMMQTETLRALTERLERLSATDQMTGLLNRQTFLDRLEQQLSGSAPGQSAACSPMPMQIISSA